MSDYWRAKRAADREEKVMRDFYIFVRCLLDKQLSPLLMIKDMENKMEQIIALKAEIELRRKDP